MKETKDMLLGIAIMQAVLLFHLALTNTLKTDWIAIVGLILVIKGYCTKAKGNQNSEGEENP